MELPQFSRRNHRIQALFAWQCLTVLGLFLPACTPIRMSAQENSLGSIQSLIKQSKLDEADKQLQAILQKQPTNPKALELLGIVQRQRGEWPEAEATFRRAVTA